MTEATLQQQQQQQQHVISWLDSLFLFNIEYAGQEATELDMEQQTGSK